MSLVCADSNRLVSSAEKGLPKMEVTVQVDEASLIDMEVSADQLADAIKRQIEGGLDLDGDGKLYLNDVTVKVVLSEADQKHVA